MALFICQNWPASPIISQTKCTNLKDSLYASFFICFKPAYTTLRMYPREYTILKNSKNQSPSNWYTSFTDRQVWPASSDKLKSPLIKLFIVTKLNSDYREREKKLVELKSLKTDFKPGVWNVNSVLLGGLGNEPEVNGKYIFCSLSIQTSISIYVRMALLTQLHF